MHIKPGAIWSRYGIWYLSILLAFAVVAVVYVWRAGRAERHLVEAEQLLARGDYAALPDWLALPEATPATRDRALLIRARMALARGKPDEAVGPLDAIDGDGPRAVDAWFWKGRTLLAVGQPLRAAGWFRSVVDRRPDDADAHRWLAAASYDLGDHKTSLVELREVTRLDPDDPRAWRTMALLLKEDDDLEPARSAYEQALHLDPAQPPVRLELAEVLTTQGQYDEAERQLGLCSGKVPEGDRLEILARCYRARGDREKLRSLIDRASARQPNHPGLLHQAAQAEADEGRTAEAIALLDRVIVLDPYRSAAIYQRGLMRKASGDAEGAALDLARSSELKATLAEMSRLNDEAAANPEDAGLRVKIAGLCERLGKDEMAAFWYRAALASDPENLGAKSGLAALEGR
ncbi:tetratricopeptide repeat protein [Tundrisphaera lichenicola]|uniref:tetratricopeptide repeat protein n=1 Tax=Tundrisphaera lichenicola TaxID=2029860 RepID=UPI003EBA0E82